MDTFESQFNDLDAQTGIMEGAISSTITTATPQDEIDLLLRQVADDANTELSQGLTEVPTAIAKAPESKVQDEDKQLTDRLRALRPAASS
jgi:charged multivesicular body protein 1